MGLHKPRFSGLPCLPALLLLLLVLLLSSPRESLFASCMLIEDWACDSQPSPASAQCPSLSHFAV
jgi:hypothetical protein